ncbi:MAG: hypothetical protein EXS35_14270 [Pedosphaera sp.]|nr:hypothetical protein [Pedosphaera sp.]
MQPIVNLEEHPGKVVGQRRVTLADYDRLVDQSTAIEPKLPFPKGVFRFRSHAEADAWTNKHMMDAALKKARARRSETT